MGGGGTLLNTHDEQTMSKARIFNVQNENTINVPKRQSS